jgi:hypothetical protein
VLVGKKSTFYRQGLHQQRRRAVSTPRRMSGTAGRGTKAGRRRVGGRRRDEGGSGKGLLFAAPAVQRASRVPPRRDARRRALRVKECPEDIEAEGDEEREADPDRRLELVRRGGKEGRGSAIGVHERGVLGAGSGNQIHNQSIFMDLNDLRQRMLPHGGVAQSEFVGAVTTAPRERRALAAAKRHRAFTRSRPANPP